MTHADKIQSTASLAPCKQTSTSKIVREQDASRQEATEEGVPAEEAEGKFFEWQEKMRNME